MHDCSLVENRMLDLIFGELSEDERLRLEAEIERCSGCSSEYRSMDGAIRLFDEACDASLPGESFWARHREALRRRIADNAPRSIADRAAFWKHLLTFKLPLPVPVAALILIALVTLSALALRAPRVAPTLNIAAQPSSATSAPTKVIEVPVYQEKVVTRTVYVDRKVQESKPARSKSPDQPRDAQPLSSSKNKESDVIMRANLTDFQPPDDMRIRVIRRSKDDAN